MQSILILISLFNLQSCKADLGFIFKMRPYFLGFVVFMASLDTYKLSCSFDMV